MASDDDQKRIADGLFGTTPRALGSYFRPYNSLVVRGDLCVLQVEYGQSAPARPITHDDILEAATLLRRDPTLTLGRVSVQLSAQRGTACETEQTRLLVSVRAMLMLDPTGPVDTWQLSEPFVDFVSRCFPKSAELSAAAKSAMEKKRSMKAWKLRARFRLSFKGTDNFARHLLLDLSDPDEPTLYIFHYTAFLKAQLDRLKREGFEKDSEPSATLKRHVHNHVFLFRPPLASSSTPSNRP
jgi:hypothetical protein